VLAVALSLPRGYSHKAKTDPKTHFIMKHIDWYAISKNQSN
jgi:hypothetical protein